MDGAMIGVSELAAREVMDEFELSAHALAPFIAGSLPLLAASPINRPTFPTEDACIQAHGQGAGRKAKARVELVNDP